MCIRDSNISLNVIIRFIAYNVKRKIRLNSNEVRCSFDMFGLKRIMEEKWGDSMSAAKKIRFLLIERNMTLTAVSYTHLDVYKRQAIAFIISVVA